MIGSNGGGFMCLNQKVKFSGGVGNCFIWQHMAAISFGTPVMILANAYLDGIRLNDRRLMFECFLWFRASSGND